MNCRHVTLETFAIYGIFAEIAELGGSGVEGGSEAGRAKAENLLGAYSGGQKDGKKRGIFEILQLA